MSNLALAVNFPPTNKLTKKNIQSHLDSFYMAFKKVIFYPIFLACFISTSAYSQSSNTSANEITALPEEIIITRELPTYEVKRLIFDAEESLYDLFNELNDDKRYKISCNTDNRINSHFSERTCSPQYHRDATRAEALDYLAIFRTQITSDQNKGELTAGNTPLGSAVPTAFVDASMHGQLKSKMEELANNNPEFLAALIKYVELKEQYTRLRDN